MGAGSGMSVKGQKTERVTTFTFPSTYSHYSSLTLTLRVGYNASDYIC